MRGIMSAESRQTWAIGEDTLALVFSVQKWGISRTGNLKALLKKREEQSGPLTAQERDQAYRLSKQLIDSPEYDAIDKYLYTTKQWIKARSVPSFFQEGCFLLREVMVEPVEAYLAERRPGLDALISAFQDAYPGQVATARALLEPDGQFNIGDYPATESLPSKFGWTRRWIEFRTPDRLPAAVRAQQIAEMENMWSEAAESVTLALREAFKSLVSHAVEKLTPGPDGKKKVFRDSLVSNISEFLETFQNRNVTNDTELARLVEKARAVMTGVSDAQVLRDNESVREAIRLQFARMSGELETMVAVRPGRRFKLDND